MSEVGAMPGLVWFYSMFNQTTWVHAGNGSRGNRGNMGCRVRDGFSNTGEIWYGVARDSWAGGDTLRLTHFIWITHIR